jgi:WD40 repeat protein
LWDVPSGQPVGEPMREPPGPWLSLAFGPGGDTLASGSYDGIIQLWDVETGQAVGPPWTDQMTAVTDLAFSPDGVLLLSGSGLRLWQVETGQPEWWDGGCGLMALSADGAELACTKTDPRTGDLSIYVADLETGQDVRHMAEASGAVYDLTFSPDGTMLAMGSGRGRVQLWSAVTGEVQGEWTLAEGEPFDYVISVVFSPDGTRLAACNRTGAHDWTIWLLDLETSQTAQVEEIW